MYPLHGQQQPQQGYPNQMNQQNNYNYPQANNNPAQMNNPPMPTNPMGQQQQQQQQYYYPQNIQPYQYNIPMNQQPPPVPVQQNQQINMPIQMPYTHQHNVGMFYYQQQKLKNDQTNQVKQKTSGYQAIDYSKSIVIRQQVRSIEKGCCESELSYLVVKGDEHGREQSEPPILKVVEQSECCQRCLCWGSCRPFELHTLNLAGEQEIFLKALRKHTCTFFCLDRPYVEIFRFDNFIHSKIGGIKHKFGCFGVNLEIFDSQGVRKWQIKGSTCQMGILCRAFCCSACKKGKLKILDGGSQVVSQFFIENQGCCKCCSGDQDRLHVVFPEKADYQDKILLTFAALMLQYRYFEDNACMSTQDHHVY